VIWDRSSTAPLITFESRAASPTPMLTTIFTSPGTSITFVYSNVSWSWALISSRYFVLRRGVTFGAAFSDTWVITAPFLRPWRNGHYRSWWHHLLRLLQNGNHPESVFLFQGQQRPRWRCAGQLLVLLAHLLWNRRHLDRRARVL